MTFENTDPRPAQNFHGAMGEHLLPRVRPYLSAPASERLKRVSMEELISYPELEKLLNEARWLVEEPRTSRARGMYIGGQNGSGKTSIARILANEYPISRSYRTGGDKPRVLSINLSGIRTTKALLGRILQAANVPLSSTRSIHDHEQVVIDTLRAMRCSLLITDETQDILMGRPAEQIRVIEVLKRLMNELSLPVLALGTPEGKDAFRSDPHMAARFEIYMIPKWGVGDRFGKFLEKYEQSLPLKRPSNLSRPEVQKVLIAKSSGCLDVVLRKIRLVAQHAIVDGTESITVKALEQDLLHPSINKLRNDEAH